MPRTEPAWWYGPGGGLAPRLLAPAARIWGHFATRRIVKAIPHHTSIPVICVGNFTAGGTGKTPLSIRIAKLLIARGERPAFLTRGYGGRIPGPHFVNTGLDLASDVGDEPLLLACHAPVMVSRDRRLGAMAIERHSGIAPPTVIVMDDGLQNPSIAKNLTIAVVDGRRGVGNSRVIPAGPLRAPMELQLALASAILVNRPRGVSDDEQHVVKSLRQSFHGPVLEATIEPSFGGPPLKDARVLALAGIANPARFIDLLREMGANLVATRCFADHHAFTEKDAASILDEAKRLDARILTTEKDWVRLLGAEGKRAELRERAEPLMVDLRIEPRDEVRLAALIDAALGEHRKLRSKP